ncbi:MAG: hypothetical protein OEY14_08585 [Myxococcales bacterium]|nr:hypothetical protein [Myxococcales bacterium]
MRYLALSLILLGTGCSSRSASPPDPISEQELACARLSACAPLEVDLFSETVRGYDACRFGFSSDALLWTVPRATRCVLEASDCAAALTCVHAEPAAICPTGPICEGNLLRDCFAGIALARDCAAEGMTCIDNGNLVCGEATSCTEDRCEGDQLLSCFGGVLEIVIECEPGLCYVDPETGDGHCRASVEPCEFADARCEGDVAVACSRGYESRRLCAPGMCRTDDGAYCRSPAPCASSCDGTDLLACVSGGRQERIDCTQWGSGCVTDASGAAACAL